MSYRIPANTDQVDSGSESGSEVFEELDDDRFSDWQSSVGEPKSTPSFFDETVHPTPEAAQAHDAEKHGFNFGATCTRLGLDMYGRIRLVNWLRKEARKLSDIEALSRDDPLLKDDSLLIPVLQDDPMLLLDMDDWSDDEEPATRAESKDSPRLAQLEAELAQAKEQITKLQDLMRASLEEEEEVPTKGKGKARDDDTHYFGSYEENDIHEIMLKDTTRTVSYARFILSNPDIFKGAVVMDVGCGTGILSMFAAKAGAKHVYAIEASGLASKARENIKKNGFDNITVIQGKVEDITLPVDKVDVIVSEWMGYMLLYESMLDSVLHARNRYLAPTGLMAPSQTRLVLSAITGQRIWKERIDFWKSVYGFDMTTMSDVYFQDGMIDTINPNEVVTDEVVLRDIDTHVATPKSLDFHSSFSLKSTKDATVRAFLTHFDTFFSTSREPVSSSVDTTRIGDDYVVSASAPGMVSFTTGPRGKETHWRQVAFLLHEPIELKQGDNLVGKFYCRKSATNSRELDVDIHYRAEGSKEEIIQSFKVR